MSPALALKIARREFLSRVRTRAFVVMTVAVPLFIGLYLISLPLLGRPSNRDLRIAILDRGTGLGPAVVERIRAWERPHVTITQVVPIDRADAAARVPFNESIQNRSLDGYLILERDESPAGRARYYSREAANPALVRDLRLALQSAAMGQLLSGTGVEIEDITRTQKLDVVGVTVSDQGEREGGFGVALGSTMTLAMLLYVAVLINGQGMATAIVEEKSSRLIEVILGAVTATEFMVGKIVGVVASGLTQLAIWLIVLVVVLAQAAPVLAIGGAFSGVDLTTILTPRLLFYFAIFFALGYLLYSILFAIIAVTCTSTEELGQSMMAAILPMVIAMMMAVSVITNPGAQSTRILSFIPLFTPLVMLARVNVLMPPLWEVWLGIALMIVSSIGAAWAASKIFRYALLMTGKRPTLPDLIRVVKA